MPYCQKTVSVILIFTAFFLILSRFSLAQNHSEPASTVPVLVFEKLNGQTEEAEDYAYVRGEMALRNINSVATADAYYDVMLYKGRYSPSDPIFSKFVLYDKWTFADERINIASNGVKTLSYEVKIPKTVPSGEYTLRFQFLTKTGKYLAWKDFPLTLSGSGEFIRVLSGRSFVFFPNILNPDGKKLGSTAGAMEGIPAAKIGDDAVLTFRAEYEGGKTVEVHPLIKVYQRDEGYNPEPADVYEMKNLKTEFSAKQKTRKITVAVPPLQYEPDSYLFVVRLADGGKKILSGPAEFRIVIEGLNAKIHSLNLAGEQVSEYLKSGTELPFKLEITGPADASELLGATLKLVVRNKNGKLLGETEFDFNVKSGGEVIKLFPSVVLAESGIPAKAEARALYQGKTLDYYELSIPAPSLPFYKYLAAMLAAVAALIILVVLRKKYLSQTEI